MREVGGHVNGQPFAYHCPMCGGAVERLHRHALDRWVSLFTSVHRYHCTNPVCGWDGIFGDDNAMSATPSPPVWRTRTVWFVIGVACALGAVQGARLYLQAHPVSNVVPVHVAPGGAQAQSLATPPGQDFNGEALPPTDALVIANRSPLNLLRSCAWGVPGGNKYRGTVEQALSAAALPSEVVTEISEMVKRGWDRGQVEISRVGIFTPDRRRNFGKSALAMGFGNSLCFDMRVNFKPGHVEYASLYEATDRAGKTYTVMVPYVCQNVAVLGERYEADDSTPKLAEPATWAMIALGLGVLAWSRWRRRRLDSK